MFEDRGNMDKKYQFQILLPNGITIHLKFKNPEPKMPFGDFIRRVEEEYVGTWRQSGSLKQQHEINRKSGSFLLVDADDMKIQNVVNFETFKPHECRILRLQVGLRDSSTTFENMWDLTHGTDILKELPQEYTFETALADWIDNSMQAVCSSERGLDKYISVDVADDMISIFDTGPGMDGGDENSIVNWGKMGAALHRSYKEQEIGGKPPYFKPYFGMFGYGQPVASMKLGRHVLLSFKTKDSKKVHTFYLDRDALLSISNWKIGGSMRDSEEIEISRSPHGSLTNVVQISEPKSKLDISQLQYKLKDIYFPCIQYDEESILSGKKITPVKVEVNGIDLTEIQGGEIAITNLHSCNGPDFVLQLQFSCKQDNTSKSPDSETYTKANARLKCVYFPIVKGKQNINRILEWLESEGCSTGENFETIIRVSIRRLGHLLPDAGWGWPPFMDLKQKRGDLAQLLKSCCRRVKCFIDTDAAFNPTPPKTYLAHHSPFTTAMRNFGNVPLENEKDIEVHIYRDGNLLNPCQLKMDYENWILHMPDRYDEADCGQDQPRGTSSKGGQLQTTGTINILYFRKNEFLVAADSREVFSSDSNNYIIGDHKKKIAMFGEVVVTFNGDFPIGNEILTHLETTMKKKKRRNTFSVDEIAEEAFNCNPRCTGSCTMYTCGLLDDGTPCLHTYKINISKTVGSINLRKESKQKKMSLVNPTCRIADGHGSRAASNSWTTEKEFSSYTSANIGREIAKSLVTAAVDDIFVGGELHFHHIQKKDNVPTKIESQKRTTIEWYAKIYNWFPNEYHQGAIFVIYNKNKLNQDSFLLWLSEIQARCPHFVLGSPFAKILGEDLFLSRVRVSAARRDDLLLTGNRNDILFPYLGQYVGRQGIRECCHQGSTFFVVEPSEGFLANLKVENNINESRLVPENEKVYV